METNAKIRTPEQRTKDKTLSRRERTEAAQQLKRERYLADHRPSMSLKKQMKLDAMLNFVTSATFLTMFTSEVLGIHGRNTVVDTLMVLFVLAAIVSVAVYFRFNAKYKRELPDELSQLNTLKATQYANAIIVTLFAIVLLISGAATRNSVTVGLSHAMYLLVGMVFLHEFLTKILFIVFEGSDDEEEDDE